LRNLFLFLLGYYCPSYLDNDGQKDCHEDVDPNPGRRPWFIAVDEIKKSHGEKGLLLSVNIDIIDTTGND
jgi:hypothetical protein